MNNKKKISLILPAVCILLFSFLIVFASETVYSLSLSNLQISNSFGTAINPDIIGTDFGYALAWSDDRREGEGEREIYFTKLNGFGQRVSKEIRVNSNSNKVSDEPSLLWSGNLYALVWSEYSKDNSENENNGCELNFTNINKDGTNNGGIKVITSDNYGTCPVSPSISWTDSTYGLVWSESRAETETSQIFFIRLDYLGERRSNEIQISNTLNSKNPSIVWTGSEYGIVWQADDGIYFIRLDINGEKQGDDVKVSSISQNVSNPDIVWQGSYYGIVWQGDNDREHQQIYFIGLDEQGNTQTEKEITITSNSGDEYSASPSIIWGNYEYGITWQQEDEFVYFSALDIDGNKNSEIIQISNNSGEQVGNPIISLDVSKYIFVWHDNRGAGREIYFAQLYFSDIIQKSQNLLSSFIKNTNGSNPFVILLIVFMVCIVLFLALSLFNKRNKSKKQNKCKCGYGCGCGKLMQLTTKQRHLAVGLIFIIIIFILFFL